MSWAVRFDTVSKRYRGGGTGYASLRNNLARLGRGVASAVGGRPPASTGWRALGRISSKATGASHSRSSDLIGPAR